MRKDFLEIGKFVGSHGIKGLAKVQHWCDSAEFFAAFKTLYLKDNGGYTAVSVQSAKPHGNIMLLKLKGVETIEQAEEYRGKILYIKRSDARLEDGRYFIEEVIGCAVFDFNTKEPLGVLKDVTQNPANDIWHIEKDGKEYLMPAIKQFINKVDIDSEEAYVTAPKGIFDDED
jgi:16S rRNA processing protein RimM